jgi:membrane protein DedA with SNARE-associated domain
LPCIGKGTAIHTALGSVAGFIVATISGGGYLGLAALMAVESACIPLPSEIIMPFAGFLVSTGRFSLLLVATAGAIGCNLGSAIAYEIGARGGQRAAQRWGSWVMIDRSELDRMQRYFHRYGGITVLVCRMLPVVRTFIALPAGVARMPRVRFHAYTFIGSWPWCLVLAWIGLRLGRSWNTDPRLRQVMHQLDGVVLAVLAVGFVWFIWRRWRHRPMQVETGPGAALPHHQGQHDQAGGDQAGDDQAGGDQPPTTNAAGNPPPPPVTRRP